LRYNKTLLLLPENQDIGPAAERNSTFWRPVGRT